MESKVMERRFKQVHVAVVILLTIVTLGVYLGYWFLKERSTLKKIEKGSHIPIKLWWLFTILLGLSFIYHFIGPILLTSYGLALLSSFDMIMSFYFLGLLYYSVFRMKDILQDRYEDAVFSSWLLVLFHIWYLQFKMNRLEGSRNDGQDVKLKKALA
ncbi:DUF4234 domain-containing protein [Bacillus tuaregi]|uniref:DUF4234 domain-containing protein n=1 Tax=Bacillus tuaregi TaxID=1816695 RepID=UPI0008F947D6|nr:DUF4234 domain-containing protein [Bacillus tuaregi]